MRAGRRVTVRSITGQTHLLLRVRSSAGHFWIWPRNPTIRLLDLVRTVVPALSIHNYETEVHVLTHAFICLLFCIEKSLGRTIAFYMGGNEQTSAGESGHFHPLIRTGNCTS